MNLIHETILDSIGSTAHPTVQPQRCLNRLQRRYPCTICADLCPSQVFPARSGEAVSWERCRDCSLCVSACPSLALIPSAETRRDYTEAMQEAMPLRITCHRDTQQGEIHVGCLAALDWELLALLALQGELILIVRNCDSCPEQARRILLEENLQKLEAFLGKDRFLRQIRQIRAKEAVPRIRQSPTAEKTMTRQELFSHLLGKVTRRAVEKAEERFPFLTDDKGDGLWLRRLLAKAVREEKAAERSYRLWLPRFNTDCFGCGICEKVCPHKALTIRQEDGETRLILIEPYKCSACTLCVKLCPHGGLDGLFPLAVPHLDQLALIRVHSLSCTECGAVLLPGTDPPLCRRCAKRIFLSAPLSIG